MLLNFDFLFLILFSFLSFFFISFFICTFFFSFFLFFLLHTRTPTLNIYLRSLFDFLFFQLSLEHFSPSLSLSFVLSLTHTHTKISLPQSHTNKFSFIHAQITSREQRLESSPLLRTCNLITILVKSTIYMVFFFFFVV